MRKKIQFSGYSVYVSCIASIAALLFGFNTSVIAGAILFIRESFGFTDFQVELIVSTLVIGAIIGAFSGGFITDYIGRKKGLFVTGILFLIGLFILSTANEFWAFLAGRFVVGLGIGIASMVVPLYIAEMATARYRGALVSLNQLGITLGILLGYIVSLAYSESDEWREMFSIGFIPVIIQLIALFFIPETPSWLRSQGKNAKAEKILHRLCITHPSRKLIKVEKEDDQVTRRSWSELFKPGVRKAFLVGIGISIIQQITGINVVIYYAPRIFQDAGYSDPHTAIFAAMLVGIVNVVMTFVALWLVDRLGRKPLLITGLIGMTASLAVLGFAFVDNSQDIGLTAVGGLMIYVAFFAMSLGPIAWLIISEIYPLGIRGRAMGIASFSNWLFNYIISLTFLTFVDDIGTGPTFWIYAIICLLSLWFVMTKLPETKGKTFKEIRKFWS